jgi:hypothetical protein
MRASVGDWLITESSSDHAHFRRAKILQTQGSDGEPPYLVHWVDNDHESLIFPGPDSQILTPDQLAHRDVLEQERILQVQHEISAGAE